jgi:hypothetical protein
MQSTAFFCDSCGRNLDEAKDAAPIVAQISFGITPIGQARHPEGFDFSKVAMPDPVRAFLNQPVPQMHVCTDCFSTVVAKLVAGGHATASGEKRALHAARQQKAEQFADRGFVSIRPEHPNRVVHEQRQKAERERAKQRAGDARPETADETRARLKRELAALDSPKKKTRKVTP